MLQDVGERENMFADITVKSKTKMENNQHQYINQSSSQFLEREKKEIWWEKVPMSSRWQPPCSCGIYITDLF